jgi:hypothetical protein
VNPAAYSGLVGEVVDLVAPFTEADPAGLLLSFLVGFGSAVGPGPHMVAGGARHPARLDLVLVGRSSRARKGTSWAVIRQVLALSDPDLISRRVVAGIASGEGLLAELATRSEGDQRSVLVVEPEIARLLRSAARSASLSALLRQAWDGDDLAVLTRRQPIKVTGASISLIGHITAEELRRRLDCTEAANGFGNRLLLCWVERARRLPFDADIPQTDLEVLGVRIGMAIAKARTLDRLSFSDDGRDAWKAIYDSLDDGDERGIVGSLLARAEAQLLRLAVTYALLDGSAVITSRHLEAAEGVWRHCEQSVRRVWGVDQVDHVLPTLLDALRAAGPYGLDGTQQRDLHARHVGGARLAAARAELARRGLAVTVAEETGGRPRIITRVVEHNEVADIEYRQVSSLSSQPQSLSSEGTAR